MREVNGWWLPDTDKHFGSFAGKGGYQLDRQAMCWKYVKKWDVGLDIGAHVGFWAKEMAARFRLVHAFEPVKSHLECLRRNIPDNVKVHPLPLGGRAHKVGMRLNDSNTGGSCITEGDDYQMVTLDSFGFPTVDFIKMDVEDWEAFVIQGGKETIKRCKPIMCVEQGHTNHSGLGYKAAQKELEDLGMIQLDSIKDDYVFG